MVPHAGGEAKEPTFRMSCRRIVEGVGSRFAKMCLVDGNSTLEPLIQTLQLHLMQQRRTQVLQTTISHWGVARSKEPYLLPAQLRAGSQTPMPTIWILTWKAYSTAETYVDTFDYFGIMIHGDSMTSGSYSIPKDDPTSGGTWPYIQNWLNSDIPNSKIILSLTTDSWLHLPASSNHMEFGLSAQAAEFQRTPPKKVRL